MQHITYVERKASAERKYDLPMEKGRAYLDQFMIGAMYDAEREISEAFSKKAGGLGYATQDMNRVDGGRQEHDEEPSEYDLMLMDTLTILKRELKSHEYGITLDIAVLSFTPEDVAYHRGMQEGAVAKVYTDVLDVWCELRGWGKQNK